MSTIPLAQRSAVAPFHVMDVVKSAARRQQTHGDVILMCVGQPATSAPSPVLRAAQAALTSEPLGYSETTGIEALRTAIAQFYRTRYDLTVDPDEVVVTTGSSGGFTALFLAAFDPGDTVAITNPGYPAYRNTLQALGCQVLDLECGPQTAFRPTVQMLQDLAEPPAGLILASPANPTGTVTAAPELAQIAQWCQDNGTLLISDEIYHGISYGQRCTSAWEHGRDAVVVGSFSKYFSMTGWRLGWMLLPRPLLRPVELLLGNLTLCPPTIAQVPAVAAFDPQSLAELDAHVARYASNRDLLLRRLPELGISTMAPCDGAFYAYADVSHLTDDTLRWADEVLNATGVALAPGIDFDPVQGHRYVRFSFCGTAAGIEQAMDRLGEYVNR